MSDQSQQTAPTVTQVPVTAPNANAVPKPIDISKVSRKAKARIRSEINKQLLEKEYVSPEVKSADLATAIYNCTKQAPFLGHMLQVLNISYSHCLQTAGVMFNAEQKRYELMINPFFFCKKMNDKNRVGILIHEILHLTHKHLTRAPMMNLSIRKRQIMNIAADMAINQFIQDLPNGCQACKGQPIEKPCSNEMCPGRCIDVKDFKDKDASGKEVQWAPNLSMEAYYEKLLTRFEDPDEDKDGNAGGNANTGDLPDTIDEHMWGDGEEGDLLEAAEDLVKRTMMKTKTDYDQLPGHIKELLDEIKQRKAALNYKALIMTALKKHASGHDRKHSWTRKNKRLGNKAPGTKVGELPKMSMYLDTSGSISIEELNEFLVIVDEFLKVGARKCDIAFFHTSMYGKQPYQKGKRINRNDIQSGGTELTQIMEDIVKCKNDLNIVITDGCYGDVNFERMLKHGQVMPHTLWIISSGGTADHPIRRTGMTVKVPAKR